MIRIVTTALAPILWGTTYIITTELLPDNRPLLVATARALPIGLLFLFWDRKLPRGIWWWRSFVLGVLNIGLFFSLLFIATYRVPGGIVATVGALQPLLVLALSLPLFGKRPPSITYIYAGLGVLGVALLVLTPAARLDAVGIAAAVGAAIAMALGVTLTKYWGRPVALVTFTGWQLTVGGLFLALLTVLFERQPIESLTTVNVLGFLWLGLLNTGLAYFLWFQGIGQMPAWKLSFLGLLSPLVAVVAGIFILDEHLTLWQLAGLLLTFVCVIAAQKAQGQGNRTGTKPLSDKTVGGDIQVAIDCR